MTTRQDNRTSPSAMRKSLVTSGAGAVAGLLNASVLILSARHGRTDEIASYTVVTSTLAMVAVAMTGASTMLYISGREFERHAVRSQRIIFVYPGLFLGLIVIGMFYSDKGYSWTSLILSGIVVLGNNFAELQYGDLARGMRFYAAAAVNCGTKLPAVALAAAGVPLTVALVVMVVLQFLAVEAVLGRSSWLRQGCVADLSLRKGRSAFRMNRHLHVYGIAEFYSGRAASVGLSLVATPLVVSHFGTVVGIYQGFMGTVYSALQIPMAGRIRRRLGLTSAPAANRHVEFLSVIAAAVAAVALILTAPFIVNDLLRLSDPSAAGWLRALALAIPFLIANRIDMLAHIGDGNYRSATVTAVGISALVTVGLVVGMALSSPLGAAGATPLAESVTVVVLGIAHYRASVKTRRRAYA